jgi:hypothetical protein
VVCMRVVANLTNIVGALRDEVSGPSGEGVTRHDDVMITPTGTPGKRLFQCPDDCYYVYGGGWGSPNVLPRC